MSNTTARLRCSEWILLSYFGYVAVIAPFFSERPHLGARPWIVFASVLAVISLRAAAESTRFTKIVTIIRDWTPIPLLLAAFREMELFLPARFSHFAEGAWIRIDHLLLHDWRARTAIESLGPLLPSYFEFCYLLVYGLPFYCIGILYALRRRNAIDRFLVLYLTGTLTAYALFPYFPSQPPRVVFPASDAPQISTWLRTFNLFVLDRATIHSAVFPSAHVSSVFSAAWGIFLLIPERKVYGWTLLLYAVSVSVATVYGRYHYAVDVVAGFFVSIWAVGFYLLFYRLKVGSPDSSAPLQ